MSTTKNFELRHRQQIPELELEAFHYRHLPTGAELLSLVNNDENKVFGVTLRTPPATSNGAAHILEHCVLCGSRRYPVKDPFLELIKGSLFTFLNAFTYPDKTCYPAASQNLQDFYNLIDVYLDAVFFPLLTRQAFLQEGWRYEPDVQDTSMEIKGVVYNEMKGVYASPDEVLSHYVRASLFPDNAYRFDYGGEPATIPTLSYEAFRHYHQTYYHPSNARFFFCGDDDPNRRLQVIDAFLSDFEGQSVDSAIELQPPINTPRQYRYFYQADEETAEIEKCIVTVNWLVGENGQPEALLTWSILQHILIGAPAAPLRRRLLDSGLGEDLAGDGFGSQLRQLTFSVGLRGVRRQDSKAVQTLVMQTLADLAHQGIDAATVQAAVNLAEFHLREQNSGGLPRGLVMMLDSLLTWLHDDNPLLLLPFEDCLSRMKANSARGGYFEGIISHDLLLNAHRTTVILEPDKNLNTAAQTAEENQLAHIRTHMSAVDRQALRRQADALRQWHDTPDDEDALASIPTLRLSDIDPLIRPIPLDIKHHRGSQILINDLPTNGICYADVGFDLHVLPEDYLPYLPLFSRGVMELGADDELDLLWQRIGRDTGGIWSSLFNSARRDDPGGASWLFLRAKAQAAKMPALVSILEDLLLHTRLDNRQKVRQMIQEERAAMESDLAAHGARLAELRLLAPHNEAYWVDELTAGVSYLQFIRDLSRNLDDRITATLDTLEDMRRRLASTDTLLCHITVEGKHRDACLESITMLLDRLPGDNMPRLAWQPLRRRLSEGFIVDSQISYVSKAANLHELGLSRHGSSAVVSNHLQNTWLWEQVRARGGAYDCSCNLRDGSGAFYMSSFRDPSPMTTVESFDTSGSFLRNANLTAEVIERSIIGAIGELDTYQLPDAKGYGSLLFHLIGKTEEARQQSRTEILSTERRHFNHMADYIDLAATSGQIVIVGSQATIEAANNAWNGRLSILKLQ